MEWKPDNINEEELEPVKKKLIHAFGSIADERERNMLRRPEPESFECFLNEDMRVVVRFSMYVALHGTHMFGERDEALYPHATTTLSLLERLSVKERRIFASSLANREYPQSDIEGVPRKTYLERLKHVHRDLVSAHSTDLFAPTEEETCEPARTSPDIEKIVQRFFFEAGERDPVDKRIIGWFPNTKRAEFYTEVGERGGPHLHLSIDSGCHFSLKNCVRSGLFIASRHRDKGLFHRWVNGLPENRRQEFADALQALPLYVFQPPNTAPASSAYEMDVLLTRIRTQSLPEWDTGNA